MKILIDVVTYDRRVDVEIVNRLIRLPFEYYEKDIQFAFGYASGSIITKNRNDLCQRMLEDGFDWIYFWDSDVVIHDPTFFDKLLETSQRFDAKVVGGVYRIKSYSKKIYAAGQFEGKEVRNFTPEDLTEPLLCDVIATGSMLIHRSVLEKVGAPWFEFLESPGKVLPEDFNFCRKAKMKGFKIAADPRFSTLHFGDFFWEHTPTQQK